jgi:hypothetical protein
MPEPTEKDTERAAMQVVRETVEAMDAANANDLTDERNIAVSLIARALASSREEGDRAGYLRRLEWAAANLCSSCYDCAAASDWPPLATGKWGARYHEKEGGGRTECCAPNIYAEIERTRGGGA